MSSDGAPMMVLYWGRWADATGAYGPFSKTCMARVEGGPMQLPVYLGVRPAMASVNRRVDPKIDVSQVVHAPNA